MALLVPLTALFASLLVTLHLADLFRQGRKLSRDTFQSLPREAQEELAARHEEWERYL